MDSDGICQRIPELAGPAVVPCAFHRGKGHPEHRHEKGLERPWKCYAACNILNVMVVGRLGNTVSLSSNQQKEKK